VAQPFSPYGTTKLAAEHLCRLYHGNYGVEAVILRYFSVYGPRQRPDMAFSRFFRAALRGEPVTVFGDGRQTRDFTFVADIVAASRAAATAPGVGGKTFNLGGGSMVSLADALGIIKRLTGRSLQVTHVPSQDGDVRDTGADTSRARAQLGYEPRTEFEDGLREQLDWVRSAEQDAAGPRR
jgi:UDP-glucose 4-epimerase